MIRLLSLVRDREPVGPGPDERLATGDLLYLLVPTSDPALRERCGHWLDDMGIVHPSDEQSSFGEFAVDATAPMEAFAVIYLAQVPSDVRADETIGHYVRRRLRHRASEGDYARIGNVVVMVRKWTSAASAGGRQAAASLTRPVT